jgi:hypothetical protein
MTITLRRTLFSLDHMAGLASFSDEGMTRRDIAVLRLGAEGCCGQSDCERHGPSCLAHGHSPWRLILIDMSSYKILAIADLGLRRHRDGAAIIICGITAGGPPKAAAVRQYEQRPEQKNFVDGRLRR